VSALEPAFAVIAAVLALAGLAKLRSPRPAAAALFALGLPSSVALVRGIGLAELALGGWCLLAPGPVGAALLAIAYAAFAVVVAGLARSAGPVPCGCFGEGSFVATPAHATIDLLAAALAATFAVVPGDGPLEWLADPLAGSVALAAVACSTWLCFVLFTAPPSIWGAPAR
jgi:methylamine utilization protein MauE